MNISTMGGVLDEWVAALEARHLANLRVPEVTRALRALSSAYVERRRRAATPDGGRPNVHGALDSAGKRAAFALFYAPLHFIAVTEVIRARGAERAAPKTITRSWDVARAQPARRGRSRASPPHRSLGIDRHPWAIDEARWTYQQLGVHGRARQGDVTRMPAPRRGESSRRGLRAQRAARRRCDRRIERRLLDTAARGGRVLVIEPIARGDRTMVGRHGRALRGRGRTGG